VSHRRVQVLLSGMIATMLLVVVWAGSAAASEPPGYVYALDQVSGGANQIYGFRLDPLTGALTALAGFPVPSGGTGGSSTVSEQMVYASGRLYVVNGGSNTLSAFTVNLATGDLAALPFSPLALGTGEWNCVAAHPSGSPVVVGNGGPGPAVASFIVTGTTATAALGSPYSTGTASPFSCAFSRDGNDFYTGGNVGASFAGFSVASGSGILTLLAGSPFNSGTNFPMAFATDGAGRLYSSNLAASEVQAFTTASGLPTGVTGNPFASGLTFGVQGVLHPGGYYLVADRGGNRVGV
jgi:6-phosphogluconolactonase